MMMVSTTSAQLDSILLANSKLIDIKKYSDHKNSPYYFDDWVVGCWVVEDWVVGCWVVGCWVVDDWVVDDWVVDSCVVAVGVVDAMEKKH